MKGLVFTEFIDFVEDKFGDVLLDELLETVRLDTKGAYTAVGTYSHEELNELLLELAQKTNLAVNALLVKFGKYLFDRLAESYPSLVAHCSDTFDLLSKIENHIHVEVRKLYKDAELPTIMFTDLGEGTATLEYHSTRKLGALAQGLIYGCIEHFNEKIKVDVLPKQDRNKHRWLFKLYKLN